MYRYRQARTHIRRGRAAKKARQERALGRWIENRDRGYRGLRSSGLYVSVPAYVDGQIDILRNRVN